MAETLDALITHFDKKGGETAADVSDGGSKDRRSGGRSVEWLGVGG
jgi:hypothetical protein